MGTQPERRLKPGKRQAGRLRSGQVHRVSGSFQGEIALLAGFVAQVLKLDVVKLEVFKPLSVAKSHGAEARGCRIVMEVVEEPRVAVQI